MSALELSRYLFLIGGLPFIALGLAHAALTPRAPADEKGLSPRDPAVRDAMSRESLRLTRRTTLWLTWVGFNLSHSLGAVLFGVVAVLIGRSPASFEAGANWWRSTAFGMVVILSHASVRRLSVRCVAGVMMVLSAFVLKLLLDTLRDDHIV